MPEAYLVIDGMWGSCGKGSLAGKLAMDRKPDVVVCNFGPNAGHTFVYKGVSLMTQQLPTGLISQELKFLLIGPGSMIDPGILQKELEANPQVVPFLLIHEHAAVVTSEDKRNEEALVAIGSTRKGTAASVTRKMMRVLTSDLSPRVARECASLKRFVIDSKYYDLIIRNAGLIQVESAQGIELSLSRGRFYPFCTGRDVTPEQVLNDCGIPHRFLRETFGVFRTYPIRVGNEYDKTTGHEVGTSGPVYSDMEELTWDALSKEVGVELKEITTVTKKVRRVFRASAEQVEHALWVMGPCIPFLNFMNYLDPKARSLQHANNKAHAFVSWMGDRCLKAWDIRPHHFILGWGPAYEDVEEIIL